MERKVKGAEAFVPGAEPVPSLEDSGYSGADLKFRIDLARDVMRGGGFYNTLSQRARETSEAMTAIVPSDEFKPLPSLPSFNFIDVCDPVLKTAILEEMLPADRDRFEVYCAKRDANIMLITAPVSTFIHPPYIATFILTVMSTFRVGRGRHQLLALHVMPR